ncbi:DUF3025 domain-containing protein [Alteromonas sp. H39]|uniref:DUF3025 domain-containing protein n=1 Tax=Alteromonas sp. H39 TaxID=3389876 RepID=UPI0039E1F45C
MATVRIQKSSFYWLFLLETVGSADITATVEGIGMTVSTPVWRSVANGANVAPAVTQCLREAGLLTCEAFPDAARLNRAAKALYGTWEGPEFRGQATFFANDGRYYEEIINQDSVVPTRENNWHDLFNACIWMQFPHTKQRLNQLHVDDINSVGLHPRTARRNRLTHFDECGVVLVVEDEHRDVANTLLGALASHAWEEVLWHQRALWSSTIQPYMFGHANLEMMLSPFIGLTGKWLAVCVPDGFSSLPVVEKWKVVDAALVARLDALDNFQPQHILRPLPLLGIPGWWHEQTMAFYQNKDYFRPQRNGVPRTIQLPL